MANVNFNAPVGAAQIGNDNSATVQQNIGPNIQELADVFSQLRQDIKQLPSSQQAEAEIIVAAIEGETNAELPKPHRLKELATKLWELGGPAFTEISKEYIRQRMGISAP